MMKMAFMFPGQGSQKVGMGLDLLETFPEARAVFEAADDALGRPISKICFEGPEDALMQTQNTQPGLFLVSAAILAVLKARGIQPQIVAGHSLGELTAYYAAGVLDLPSALALISARGEAMAAAHPSEDSAMAAIMKLDLDVVQDTVAGFADAPVVVANINCPGQVVISGQKDGVEVASAALAEKGGRAIPLKVSGAFHSPLMEKAAQSLETTVEGLDFADATVPIVLNRLGEAEQGAEALKENIPIQVISSVYWTDSLRVLSDDVDVLVEVGAGKVLSGLAKKTVPDMAQVSISDAASLTAFLEEYAS